MRAHNHNQLPTPPPPAAGWMPARPPAPAAGTTAGVVAVNGAAAGTAAAGAAAGTAGVGSSSMDLVLVRGCSAEVV